MLDGERTVAPSGDLAGDETGDFLDTESQAGTVQSVTADELMAMPEIQRQGT